MSLDEDQTALSGMDKTDIMRAEMKALMQGLSAQIIGVKSDVGEAKTELEQQIRRGYEETLELKRRMDDNDSTFADRVTSVVLSLPDLGRRPSSIGQAW